jgi:MFS family permease
MSGEAGAPGGASGVESFSHAWRALRSRNFRLFFWGQSTSVIGTWMTRVATGWLVFRLTHSAWLLGVVDFAGLVSAFALAPLAGVWVERLDRRKLLVWTQAAAAVQSLAMAALTLTGIITIGEVIALSTVQGVINAFDLPGRQSFLGQMVESKHDLSNAIAINSSMTNGGRLIGPAIAGAVIAVVGEGWCFFIDGVSYFGVIASLLMMRITPTEARRHTSTIADQLREGWTYVATFRPIRSILLVVALVSLLGSPYSTVLPVVAGQVLHGGPHTLGWLTGASGVGALISALSLTIRKSVVGLTRMIQAAVVLLGGGLVCFGLSHTLWLSLATMLFVGFGLLQGLSASNTVIQTLVPEDKRGRVMSYFTMAFVGMAPFGSLFTGALAQRIGVPMTMIVNGTVCLAGAVWLWAELPKIRAIMRPIYVEMGLLPSTDVA